MFVRSKFLGTWEKWLRIRIITSQSAFLDWENSQSFRKNYRGCHLCKKNFKKMFVRRGYRRVEYDITGQDD